MLDGQTLEIGAAERDPDQAGVHVADSANPHLAKPRWFTPGALRLRTYLSRPVKRYTCTAR
jgi:hypothetical protein